MTKEQYEEMTLAELKEIAKELGIKNSYKYKKNELIDEVISIKSNSIKKDGVVLQEKIAQKKDGNLIQDKIISKSNEYVNDSRVNVQEKKEELKTMINDSNSARGILEILEMNNFGFLRCKNYLTSSEDIYVSPS